MLLHPFSLRDGSFTSKEVFQAQLQLLQMDFKNSLKKVRVNMVWASSCHSTCTGSCCAGSRPLVECDELRAVRGDAHMN